MDVGTKWNLVVSDLVNICVPLAVKELVACLTPSGLSKRWVRWGEHVWAVGS